MSSSPEDRRAAAFRLLPGVDDILFMPRIAGLAERIGLEKTTLFVRQTVEGLRREILEGRVDAAALAERLAGEGIAEAVEAALEADDRRGVRRAINVTGVVLHTGLGRAPVHPEVAARMAEVSAGYCVLEVDRESGKRNQRDDRLGELLCRATGGGAAIAVNNNAAAVFLCLSTFSRGKEAIVSRGELVEIGGSFRVPDVMEQAGARLREVGTTNRTRASDYRVAAGEETGLLLKVHTSNFRLVGFTEEVLMGELAILGEELGIPTAFDLGSGFMEDERMAPLPELGNETRVRDAVASGVDVVTFSGDKLIGGPQAGLLVGKREAIDALRANPVYRAMRLDKSSLAGLEATLELVLDGRGDEIPARRLLRAGAEALKVEAEALAARLAALPGLEVAVVGERSQPGSGSAPDVFLDTWAVRVTHRSLSAETLSRRLRRGEPIVFARIQDDRLFCDPRTLLEGEAEGVIEAFAVAVGDRE